VNILCLSPIDHSALERLRRDHEVTVAANGVNGHLDSLAPDREVVIFRSGVDVSADFIDRSPHLKLLIRAGSGLDNVDVERARERDIRLVRIPGPGAQAVAELTFGLMLSVARNITLADRLLREGHWPKKELGGPLLQGKTLGIVGAGNIGARVGDLGVAWGMRVLGCVARPNDACRAALGERGIDLAPIDDVVASADFLSVHVPLMDATRNLIDTDRLAQMKPGSILVNTARGGVVDEVALRAALLDGTRLRGAGLDVHAREGEGTISSLADLPNVVLTPHIGAMATDSQRAIGERIIRLLAAFTAGRIDAEAAPTEAVA
jgi:D-3-phosphoglycerate dehydrogenase / 2-oxoglutarate reductase